MILKFVSWGNAESIKILAGLTIIILNHAILTQRVVMVLGLNFSYSTQNFGNIVMLSRLTTKLNEAR